MIDIIELIIRKSEIGLMNEICIWRPFIIFGIIGAKAMKNWQACDINVCWIGGVRSELSDLAWFWMRVTEIKINSIDIINVVLRAKLTSW